MDSSRSQRLEPLYSAAFFFFLLCGYYLLRPVRESMGLRGGVNALPYLFLGTLILTLALQPLLAFGLRRKGRAALLPWIFRFFLIQLLAFAAAVQFFPDSMLVQVGRLYYIWLSAFNLCVVSLFWSWMADLHTTARGKEVYGWIGAGGTLGAVVGSILAEQSATRFGEAALLLMGALFLEVALRLARRARRHAPGVTNTSGENSPSASWTEGFRRVASSSYLRTISLYLFLMTTLATFVYFQQATLVAEASFESAERTALFAGINKWVNGCTLVIQLFLTRAWLSRLGLRTALVALPVINLIGFIALAWRPSLLMLIPFQVTRRAIHYAIARPARELLFTKVDGVTRYQSKNLIDSFVYRSGDALGAAAFGRLSALTLSLSAIAALAVPLAAFWGVLGWWLGSREPEPEIANRDATMRSDEI